MGSQGFSLGFPLDAKRLDITTTSSVGPATAQLSMLKERHKNSEGTVATICNLSFQVFCPRIKVLCRTSPIFSKPFFNKFGPNKTRILFRQNVGLRGRAHFTNLFAMFIHQFIDWLLLTHHHLSVLRKFLF